MKRIFDLLKQRTSQQMFDCVERLNNGEDVPLEELYEIPEVVYAENRLKMYGDVISTVDMPNREMMQNFLSGEMTRFGSYSGRNEETGKPEYNNPVKYGGRIDIVIGLPASGKSSAVLNQFSVEHHSKLIDNDEAKKMIPEYDNGWGAGIVHKESQNITDGAMISSLMHNENIVYPKIGGNLEKLVEDIEMFKEEFGYEVYVHYVDIDYHKSESRLLSRFVDDGRYFEPNIIRTKYVVDGVNKVEQTYEALKEMTNLVDGYSKWDNNGTKPVLIEASESLLSNNVIKRSEKSSDFWTNIDTKKENIENKNIELKGE